MSSEKKNPIEEMIEVLKAVNEAVGGDFKEAEKHEHPTSPEGYESLIPDDLVKKMQEIEKLVDDTKVDMIKFSASLLNSKGRNSYAHLQAVMFLEAHKDLISASYRLAGIHELDKPMIDELAEEDNISPEQFIHNTIHEMAVASVLNN